MLETCPPKQGVATTRWNRSVMKGSGANVGGLLFLTKS
jgi:hypothetical protein